MMEKLVILRFNIAKHKLLNQKIYKFPKWKSKL